MVPSILSFAHIARRSRRASGRRWVALLLALLVFPAALAAQSFDNVRATIRKELVDSGAPSIAVSVARKGEIVWEEGFGWADRENRRPATPHTVYSLASISKPMTATGIMLLVQSGKIRLDAPVNDYLGSSKLRAFAGDAKDATVRRLANHSAGLPTHVNFFYYDEPYRPPVMDETIRRYGILISPPGEQYRYANLGYGILDYVISRVSGRSYEDFLRQEVFIPLGLTRTSVDVGPGLEDYQAIRYGRDGLPIPFYDFDHRGASAVYASAHDLARFGMFHLKAHLPDQKQILTDESIDEMQKLAVKSGENSGYGVGWMLADRNGYRLVSHGGAMGGVRNTILLVPSEKIAIAVLCNLGNNEIPSRVAEAVLAELLPGWKPRQQSSATTPRPYQFRPPAELVGAWKGALVTHAAEHPFTLQVFESGDVHAQLGDQMKMLVNDVRLEDGILTGRMPANVGTDDAGRKQHYLRLSLKLRGTVLNGSATAVASGNKRDSSGLPSWLELKRQ